MNLETKCQWDDHMICRHIVDFAFIPWENMDNLSIDKGKVRERSYDLYLIISHMLRPEIELQGEYWAH